LQPAAATFAFALPVFLGAFLLFQIQPIVARRILPWFGGGASVWTACMLFFQVALLAGYLYAHVVVKHLSSRRLLSVHVSLLACTLLFLPVLPATTWKPADVGIPVLRILILLAATVGLPYMTLATTSPIVQALYARQFGNSPYRLFALSNVGSMLGLLSYPVFIEPALTLRQQSWLWASGYGIYAIAVAVLLLLTRTSDAPLPVTTRVRREFRLSWILLPACASTLLLAATNFLTQNVPPTPFLWILPLAAYIASFIVAFEGERWYNPSFGVKLGWFALMALAAPFRWSNLLFDVPILATLVTAGVFAVSLVCHGETVRRKPAVEHLTRFYLAVSTGGAVGGIAISVIAPLIMPGTTEYLASILICAAVVAFAKRNPTVQYKLVATVATACIAVGGFDAVMRNSSIAVHNVRNFYGSLRVMDDGVLRTLVHGSTIHGSQSSENPRTATSYYMQGTGVYQAIESTRRTGQRVGVVGLGAGTLAVWSRPGDEYTFFEIDPECIRVARDWFTYLGQAEGKVRTVEGDGRLELERDKGARFEVLAVDAFSGDSVPAHLLTAEALDLYMSRLAPNGILAFHISTMGLDLEKVISGLVQRSKLAAVIITTGEDRKNFRSPSVWALLARNADQLPAGRPLHSESVMWTDDRASLWPILRH
jgi:spermidine synthase